MKPLEHQGPSGQRQHGFTIVELLVGLTIGLMTIAAAMAALMVSRDVSGTVSDSSQIEQQGSYALRVIGQQIRQAGTPRLNLGPLAGSGGSIDPADPVGFEVPAKPGYAISGVDDVDHLLYKKSPRQYALSISYRKDPVYQGGAEHANGEQPQRNCLGTDVGSDADPTMLQSRFVLDKDRQELVCNSGNSKQPDPNTSPIVGNVANFSVRYLVQTDANSSEPKFQYSSATKIGDASNPKWARVSAVEVCLVIYGNEAIDMPVGTSYTDCPNPEDGKTRRVDITDQSALPANRVNRLHTVFRSIYQVRSQLPFG